MAGNEQKTPFAQSFMRFSRQTANVATQVLGKSLPASIAKVMNALVTINYEVTGNQKPPNVTMPVLMSRYVRFPIQSGDLGGTVSFDAYMGGVSGLGGGTADLSQRGNLATSVWHPVSHADWPTEDTSKLTLTGGPNGIKMKDSAGTAIVTIDATGINMSFGGHTLVINSTGVVIDGKIFLTHEHTLVQTGTSDTGPVA